MASTHPSGLTEYQRRFVLEYTRGEYAGNATRCALIAGSKARDACKAGCETLRNRKVKAAIEDYIAEREVRTTITAEAVMLRLWEIGNADMGDYVRFRSIVTEHNPDNMDADELAEADLIETDHGPVARQVLTEIVLTDWDDLTASQRRAIQSVEQGQNGVKFKLNPKIPALVELGKYLGIAENIKISSGADSNQPETITEDMTDKEAMMIYAEKMRRK